MQPEISLKGQRIFSLAEAQATCAVLQRVTRRFAAKVDQRISQIELIYPNDRDRIYELEAEVDELVSRWKKSAETLGAITRGLWIAEFDAGDGYYCWKYPESKIEYWRSYQHSISQRIPLKNKDEKDVATKSGTSRVWKYLG